MTQTNTKSVIVATQAFAACANKERAVILGVFPGAMCFPSQATAGLSGYLVSKMAQVKLLEYVAAENSHIFTACAHPGMIDSPLFRASGATTDSLPMDTRECYRGTASSSLANSCPQHVLQAISSCGWHRRKRRICVGSSRGRTGMWRSFRR